MIAADDDRRLEFARRDHGVEGEPEPVPVAQAHPADARRQALELDPRPRHVEPIVEMGIAGHQLLDLGVGPVNVLRIARQGRPAERPDPAAEHGPDIGRDEAREIEGVLDAFLERHLADVVAVVDSRNPGMGVGEHRPDMLGHRRLGGALDALGIASAPFLPLRERPPLGQIAIDGIVGRGLVGDDVGPDAAPHELGHHFVGIAEQRD